MIMITKFLFIIWYTLMSQVVCDLSGYYCIGPKNGNLHLKCVKTQCNSTKCATVIDYEDKTGPIVTIDSGCKASMILEMSNTSIIHVLFLNYIQDSIKSKIYRLIKPIIVKVQLAEPGVSYKLRFIKYVNGGPTEEVISKETRENYFGCDFGKTNPTCGLQYYSLGDPILFSEGFCCSCHASINIARQPESSSKIKNYITIQQRGKQDCTNISTSPGYANPFTYHESSHCFRYSDLWLTDAKGHQRISIGLMSYIYEVGELKKTEANNLTAKFILIPQPVPEIYRHGLPQLNDSPGKYLVIDPNWISDRDGAECDKIDVRHRAFYEQPNRCGKPRGSCLSQQPIDLLRTRSDNKHVLIEDFVRKGDVVSFDGERMIVVPSAVNTVAAERRDASVRGVLEIGLTDNAVVDNEFRLQISEIHAIQDDDCVDIARVRVYVTNLAVKTAQFFVGIFRKERQTATTANVVHSQQTVCVLLTLECRTDKCDEVVRLYGDAAAIVAVVSRRFTAARNSSCYCLWHRQCQCYRHQTRPGAQLHLNNGDTLSQAEYNAAGFLGDVPPGTVAAVVAARDRDTVAASLVLLTGFTATMLVLGLLKALSPYWDRGLWLLSDQLIAIVDGCGELKIGGGFNYFVRPIATQLGYLRYFVANILFFFVFPVLFSQYLVYESTKRPLT